MTFGKLLGYMVNERGIEVDPDKIRVILDMPMLRTEREVRGFLCRLQYISRFIAKLIDIFEPIFRLLRKSQPTVWDDQCQRTFERIREYLLSHLVLVASYTRESIVVDHLASLPVSDGRVVDDDFPDKDIATVTSFSATQPSMIDIPVDTIVRPLLIELRSILAYCCLIDEAELDDGLPWYHNIYQRSSVDQVMREVHAGVYGLHMGGHICPKCQMHEDLIHVPPSELHALTSPWPFPVRGINIIGKISPKSSCGHEFILVTIDYFTKWVETASFARLTSTRIVSFIRSHIIYRYRVPHELISDRGVHFRAEVDILFQRYGI
ncbi:hypothetical protein CK203_091844 [Vitis vinifera]|uniref:Integrase catalytic domain-containing protein n=1 Tax=Vitis vinifera TaxID=29760 RepID=A0A438BM01_VITVI|nr:hypothetical protein CK203_091844 [Vitis vinifera]